MNNNNKQINDSLAKEDLELLYENLIDEMTRIIVNETGYKPYQETLERLFLETCLKEPPQVNYTLKKLSSSCSNIQIRYSIFLLTFQIVSSFYLLTY